jgi:NitT/TauT family transport system substrate-binding protein
MVLKFYNKLRKERGVQMKKLSLIIFLIFSCMMIFACQNGSESEPKVESVQPKKPLRVGLVTWIGYGPFYIAQEKGFFKEYGIEVKLERIEGDAERRAAIASGNTDASCMTVDAVTVLRSRNIPVKIVMAIDSSNGGDGIVAVKEVKKIEDLKGKKIAFPTGLPSHFFLYSVLNANGLKMSDIKPIVMDADKAGAAFAGGQVEVAVTWEPWLSKAQEMVNGHILIDSKQHYGYIEDVLFVREDVIAKRPDDIKALIKGWYKAVDFVKSNPDEAKTIIGKAFGLTKEKVEELLPKVIYEGKERNKEAFGTPDKPGFLYSLYNKISEAWLAEKVIEKRDKPEDGIHPDFVRSIQ